MASKALKLVGIGLMLIVGVAALMALSCDRRHGTGPSGTAEVGSVRISLSPGNFASPRRRPLIQL